jgi:hypothetical protein
MAGPQNGELPIFVFESVFLKFQKSSFSFIGVGVTLEARLRPS